MPYCPLSVSCDLSKKQTEQLVTQITDALVQIAKKPPTAIMVNITANCNLFLNNASDAAFFEIIYVGMDNAMTEKLGVRFLDIIADITGIPYDRIFVYFAHSEPVSWVLRGHTLEYWKKQWAAEAE
ncbi:MAG: phenylpyruvate tautomerase MIF-related protein [Chlamydiota bacterium]